jgi:hypothetical protein
MGRADDCVAEDYPLRLNGDGFRESFSHLLWIEPAQPRRPSPTEGCNLGVRLDHGPIQVFRAANFRSDDSRPALLWPIGVYEL